jgi:hypothetical protein
MEVSGQIHELAALLLGIKSLVSIGKEAAWIPELVWMLGLKKNSLPF